MKFYFTGLPVHVSGGQRIYPSTQLLRRYHIKAEDFVRVCVREHVIGVFPEHSKEAEAIGELFRLSQGRLALPTDWARSNGISSRKCVYLFCIEGGILISAHSIFCNVQESKGDSGCICMAAP